MKITTLMTHDVEPCSLETDLVQAAQLMADGDFGVLPVTESHGRVVGVLTDRDIVLVVARETRTPAHISVREAMSRTVHACLETDDAKSALAMMKKHRVRRLPVLDQTGRLKGIASLDDLVRGAAGKPGGLSCEEIVDAFKSISPRRRVAVAR